MFLLQDMPLAQLFAHSQTLQERAIQLPSSEASTRARQAEALSALTRCDQIVESLALFSRCGWHWEFTVDSNPSLVVS